MRIDQLIDEWDKDCVIDEEDLSAAALKTPNLHAKYLRILIDYKLKKSKATTEIKEKKVFKSKYFRGLLTTEELKEVGLEPYQYRVLKGEVDDLIEADSEIIKINTRIEYYTTAITLIESILTELKSRSFHTRLSMDWIKFRSGT